MNNITRFDPLNEIACIDPFLNVDDMFNRFMMRPIFRTPIGPQIKMDVSEADGKYQVKAEIPGVKKEDIHVSVDGNLVSISAEVKQEKETREGERVISSERSYGMASRSFSLGSDVDQENIKASYNNGVLELILPKKSGPPSKEISIS
jgi:HSP20 family protein